MLLSEMAKEALAKDVTPSRVFCVLDGPEVVLHRRDGESSTALATSSIPSCHPCPPGTVDRALT